MSVDPRSDGFPAVKSEIDPESFRDHSLNEDAAAQRPYLAVRWLGRVEFARALALQDEMVARKREHHSMPDELLLLEHEPVTPLVALLIDRAY